VGLHLAALYLWQVPLAHGPQLGAAGAAVGLFRLAWGAPHLVLQLALLLALHALYALLGAYQALAQSPEYQQQRQLAAARSPELGAPGPSWSALVAQEMSLHPAAAAPRGAPDQQPDGRSGAAGRPPAWAAAPPQPQPLSPWLSMKGGPPAGPFHKPAAAPDAGAADSAPDIASTPPSSSGRLPVVELSAVGAQAALTAGGGPAAGAGAPAPPQQLERQHSERQHHWAGQQRQGLHGWARAHKLLQLLLPLLANVSVHAFESLTSAPAAAAMAMCCYSMARVSAFGSATLLVGLAALLLPSR
jgi:hypothetical protein